MSPERKHSRWPSLLLGLFAIPCLSGCPEEGTAPTPPPAATTAAPTTGSATAQPNKTASDQAEEPVCQIKDRRVWTENANPRTGLTVTHLPGGQIAVGVAIGTHPHALVFDQGGHGTLKRIPLPAGSAIAKRISATDGVRHLQRVTVTAGDEAFADYRDKYKNGHRRVACGLIGSAAPYLVFDGEPLLAVDDTGRGRKKTDARPTATGSAASPPVAGSATPTRPDGSASATAQGDGPTSAQPDPAERPKRELRDCRTFADPKGKDIWAVGSELVRDPRDDGTDQWLMRFIVAPQGARGPHRPLHTIKLGERPEKLHTLEAPVAHRLSDGSFVLVGRYRGKMLAWLLDADKRKKGELNKYGGGYPSLPRIVADGPDHLLLASQKIDLSRWKLRAIRIGGDTTLAKALTNPPIGQDDDSVAEPTLAQLGQQRWLAYHAGDRRKGRLMVVPVDAELSAVGRAHPITSAEAQAYESHLLKAGSDQLLVVRITRPGPGKPAQLISEKLSCSVRQCDGPHCK